MTGGGKPLFQIVVFRLAFSQAEPPAVIVDHDGDVIRIVEGRRAAIERGVVEVPLRRSESARSALKSRAGICRSRPGRARWRNSTGTTIAARPSAAAASCRLPGCRSDNRSRRPVALQRSGQSAAMMSAVRAPQSNPARIAFSILSASIKAMMSTASADGWPLRTAVTRKKARRAVAAQIRNDHPVARRRQQRGDIDKAVNVVGPAVQKNDRGTIGGAGFGVADIQDAGIDLLQRAERRVRSRLDRGQPFCSMRCCAPRNRSCRAERRQMVIGGRPKKRRRSWLISSVILIVSMGHLLGSMVAQRISRT